MKRILLLTSFISVAMIGYPQTNCLAVDCKSTLQLPFDSISVNGQITLVKDTVKTVQWKQISGRTSTIKSPTSLVTYISDITAGTYIYSLTATTTKQATLTAFDTIIVLPALITLPPVVSITGATNVLGTIDTLTAVASDPNPGGSITNYGWGKLAGIGTQVINGASTSKVIITGLQSGTYQFKVTVWNAAGLTTGVTAILNVTPSGRTITKVTITYLYSDGTSVTTVQQ